MMLVARIFWIAAGFLALTLLCGSIGSLLRRWFMDWRSLKVCADLVTPSLNTIMRNAVLVDKRVAGTRCVVKRVAEMRSYATLLGIGGRSRFIVVTAPVVERLAASDLHALVAHECAHHLNGDCQRHNVLQLFGRLTLLGDAFVGVLENSFGYELAADRTAVTTLHADPLALRDALRQMSAASIGAFAGSSRDAAGLTAIGITSIVLMPESSRFFARWLARARLWLALYTSDTEITYWHPAIEERGRCLEALAAKQVAAGQRCVSVASPNTDARQGSC
jgi:Zn-dependent protease with chaperone function